MIGGFCALQIAGNSPVNLNICQAYGDVHKGMTESRSIQDGTLNFEVVADGLPLTSQPTVLRTSVNPAACAGRSFYLCRAPGKPWSVYYNPTVAGASSPPSGLRKKCVVIANCRRVHSSNDANLYLDHQAKNNPLTSMDFKCMAHLTGNFRTGFLFIERPSKILGSLNT
jgi:hypothetical protein